jgi:hypothetical protein
MIDFEQIPIMVFIHFWAMSSWSHATSCIHPVQSIQEEVISTHVKAHFGFEVSHQWKLLALVSNLIKVFSIQSIWWSCLIKRIECLMQHDQSLRSALSSRAAGKSCVRDREVLLLLTIPISLFVYNQCILHCFLCFPPPWVNLGMRFLLRGEGCNTPCYNFPNYLH